VVYRLYATDYQRSVGWASTTNKFRWAKKRNWSTSQRCRFWLEFMQNGMAGMPVLDFQNVVPLEQQAPGSM